ncbi:MAG: AAA family ATPase [Anaerolineales bacterium]|nr:AAA family ATPase [Anaerolineales bacterium]
MCASTDDEKSPAAPENTPRRRPLRGLGDLSAMYQDSSEPTSPVEKSPEEEAPPTPTQAPEESQGSAEKEAPPRRRPGRSIADITSMLSGESSTQATSKPITKPLPRQQKPAEGSLEQQESGDETLEFPPELEKYLPPDLWRKLQHERPLRRGILINGLERLRSVQYLLSTYMPQHLVQAKMRRSARGLVTGETIQGSLLFADVSGFTALSERLASVPPDAAERAIEIRNKGAEQLTTIMNDYFDAMWKILSWSGGILVKFAGDAALVYFPKQEKGQQAQWAVRAGLRMLRAIDQFANIPTPSEPVTLRMKIGVATGEFLSASVGNSRRMEYAILGPAVTQTMGAEAATTGPGQLLVNAETASLLGSEFLQTPQGEYFSIQPKDTMALGDFEIKAKARRARGAIPWDASPAAIIEQMQVTLTQIQALEPYLAEELVERIIIRASERRVLSEFRLTTVLFCNFTGFETLFTTWGSEGVQRLTSMLSAYFSSMSEMISRYGGIISRIDPYSKGTKLLALFGAPVSHEDDPQRAVSAALAMNAELDALNEQWRKRFGRYLPPESSGPAIQHRIGITQGETYAGLVGSSTRREYTVMGDDVNLSARLMSAARVGQILVSQRIYEAVSAYFVNTELPAIRVKGKSKPITIYQVEGPRDDALLNRVYSRDLLVGREKEMTTALRLIARAWEGKAQAITILGPAGIGKSHLADEIIRSAATQGTQTILYQCRAYKQNTTYACWGGILRSIVGITSTDLPNTQREKLHQYLVKSGLPDEDHEALQTILGIAPVSESTRPGAGEEAKERADTVDMLQAIAQRGRSGRRTSGLDVLGQIADAKPLDGQTWMHATYLNVSQRRKLSDTIALLFQRILAASPVVIFFEDAHWMDIPSRRLLLNFMETLHNQPLLVILAQREELEEREAIGEVLNLEALDEAATQKLVAHILVSDLAGLIHQQSKGTPLFVDEISRWIKRTRQIRAEDLRGILQSSDILQKLILSSLESLSESQREVVRVIAVIGEEFRFGEVKTLLSATIQMDPVTLYSHLSALEHARLIALREPGTNPRYIFQQSLVREVLYNSLPFARRRELHSQLAAYLSAPPDHREELQARLDKVFSNKTDDDFAQRDETIAFHHERAEEWQQAALHLLKAGHLARQQGKLSRAQALFTRGLGALLHEGNGEKELTGVNAEIYFQLNHGLGDVLLLQDDFPTATASYEVALSTIPETAGLTLKTHLLAKMALMLGTQNRPDEAITRLEQAIAEAPEGLVLALTAGLAWINWRESRPSAPEWIKRCKALLPEHPQEWEVDIEILLNDMAGEYAAAKAGYQMHNHREGAALAAIRLGDQMLRAGDVRGARGQYDHAARIWQPTSAAVNGLVLNRYRQAETELRLKNIDAALAILEEAQALLPKCSRLVQVEGRDLVRAAMRLIKAGKPDSWPAWRWQSMDDSVRIPILAAPLV